MSDHDFASAVDRSIGVTAPAGFLAGTAACGIKPSGKPDVALLAAEVDAAGAAVFTRNRVVAAPVVVSRDYLQKRSTLRGVIVNAGNANACTGEQGLADAREMTELASGRLECPTEAVLVASTGVIGRPLPMEKVRQGIADAAVDLGAGAGAADAFARAIMTTDTVAKQAGLAIELAGRKVTLGGATKGVGMLAPNMATTLGFVTTDAAIDAQLLRTTLARVADRTYNCITVDGHTSTNDTLVVLASGMAMQGTATTIVASTPEAERFEAALEAVCDDLARQMVADGEGATKLIEIRVTGAATEAEARAAARAIADSPLVGTAFFGEDPNWGRITSAAGAAEISSTGDTMRLALGGLVIFDHGTPLEADEAKLREVMAADEILCELDLGAGSAEARVVTCDLSHEYITINGEYTT